MYKGIYSAFEWFDSNPCFTNEGQEQLEGLISSYSPEQIIQIPVYELSMEMNK